MTLLVEEIRLLEVRIAQLERELTALARSSSACTTLLSIPGVGLLTATAMVAGMAGMTALSGGDAFLIWSVAGGLQLAMVAVFTVSEDLVLSRRIVQQMRAATGWRRG